MSKSYIEVIENNTKIAAEQWNQFALEYADIDIFKKKIHLRPTSNGVTIVSTLDEKPMRGIHCAKTKVKETLKRINGLLISDKNLMDEFTKLGFQNKKIPNVLAEEKYQAQMIAGMSENAALKKYLGVENLIFIASEFVLLHDSNESNDKARIDRVDIIGYDGKKRLFFFELKHPLNGDVHAVEQVERYVKVYSEEKNKKDMLNVLKEYPINSVNSVNQNDIAIEGYVIWGYNELIEYEEWQTKEIRLVGLVRFCQDTKGPLWN